NHCAVVKVLVKFYIVPEMGCRAELSRVDHLLTLTGTAQFYPAANFAIGTKIFLMHLIKRPAPNAPKILGLLENLMTRARNLESSQSSRFMGNMCVKVTGVRPDQWNWVPGLRPWALGLIFQGNRMIISPCYFPGDPRECPELTRVLFWMCRGVGFWVLGAIIWEIWPNI